MTPSTSSCNISISHVHVGYIIKDYFLLCDCNTAIGMRDLGYLSIVFSNKQQQQQSFEIEAERFGIDFSPTYSQ